MRQKLSQVIIKSEVLCHADMKLKRLASGKIANWLLIVRFHTAVRGFPSVWGGEENMHKMIFTVI